MRLKILGIPLRYSYAGQGRQSEPDRSRPQAEGKERKAIHRRGAEIAEEDSYCLSGDGDKQQDLHERWILCLTPVGRVVSAASYPTSGLIGEIVKQLSATADRSMTYNLWSKIQGRRGNISNCGFDRQNSVVRIKPL